MFTLIGLALIFVGATAIVSKSILDTFDDDDTPTNPHQLVRLGGSSGAGMDSSDKDAYIKHLQGELTRLKLQSGLPPLWASDEGDAQGDANPENLGRTSHHLPSPTPSPLESPDFVINFPLIDLPFDAPYNRQKCHDLLTPKLTPTLKRNSKRLLCGGFSL